MTDVVKVRSISETTSDGRQVTANYGQAVPTSIPTSRIKALRELGAIGPGTPPVAVEPVKIGEVPDTNVIPPTTPERAPVDATAVSPAPDGGAPGVHPPEDPEDPDGRSTTEAKGTNAELPDDAPNVAEASVEDLAKYIDAKDLNGPQTVALAGGDPALAAKVLEAEKTSVGGDPRSTVTKPLARLAASGN